VIHRSKSLSIAQARRFGPLAFACLIAGSLPTGTNAQIAVRNQGYVPFSDPPINYRSNDLSDPVTQLQRALEAGKAHLVYEPKHGYLKSVLDLLRVPADSQTLVFSKTSFQYPKISPEHPRALYFNDDVYVGSVHEGKAIEIVSFDPMQGAIFYLLDEHQVDKPAFQRAELDCTQCHIAAGTRGVPGVLLRSVYPSSSGTLVPGTKSFITDQESPWSERWGGWYVTGSWGAATHMGNATVNEGPSSEKAEPVASGAAHDASSAAPSEALNTANATPLQPLAHPFDASSYLVPDSDVVAHLVLAHQTQMHNLITLTNYKTRLALYAQGGEAAVTSPTVPLSETARRQFEKPAEQLLRYLLFVNETPLPETNGRGVGAGSAFAEEFAARGPRDSRGRSLRDLDLQTRIFRYPCSYLIYSDAFDALPEPAKGYVYHRLLQILTGADPSRDFRKLTAAERQAILEILLETKHDLPQEWRDYATSQHPRVALTSAPNSTSQ
jgi:hypothetical protein